MLVAGAGNGIWQSITATAGSLVPVPTYAAGGGLAPTGIVLDPRSQLRYFVADQTNLFGTTNQGTTFTNLTGNLPGGIIRPTSLEFISNNGVNALLVGSLNNVANAQSPIAAADSNAIGTLTNWRAFGTGLPNTQVSALSYNAAVDVLAVGTFGRGVFTLYDVTSYFPQATVLQFGLANNNSVPDASFLTNGTVGNRPLIKYGTGTLTIAGNATYTGATAVNNGNLIVDGSIASSSGLDVNNGATVGGTGTLPTTRINNGGTLSPGNSIGTITVQGNLMFASAATYMVEVSPSSADRTNVTGTASLAGTMQAVFAPGSYTPRSYDILHATGGLGGTTFNGLSGNNPNFAPSLSYTATDVFLNLSASLGAGTPLNQNQQNVANALNNVFNSGGTLPPAFAGLFGLTGGNLANALSQLDGEAATGSERAAFQLTDEFLNLMLDPFVNGRGNVGGLGGGAIGFAPEEQASLPEDVALAYASILNKSPVLQPFEQRWTAWGSGFGGSNRTNGDPTVGSSNVTASIFGFAGGMDYHVSPSTVVGFALAGAGTNWGLANALGAGRSDAFQVGGYGISWFGSAYVAGALAFTNHWFTTGRTALGDQLTANFVGQTYGARLESGYRVGVLPTLGVTPYGAVQFQDFHTPAYSESDLTGGGFGLSYNAQNATDVRTELGSRFDTPTLLYGRPLVLYGRAAWAHDFVNNPSLNAVFQALPGGSFTVNGAPIPHNSALTTAGAQLFLTPHWTLLAKFDGEFANGSQTYAGSGTLRYTW